MVVAAGKPERLWSGTFKLRGRRTTVDVFKQLQS
jgi:hypothetical protein